MKLESQVASLELCKKLKELGVKQESAFYWCQLWPTDPITPNGVSFRTAFLSEERDVRFSWAAFTVAELGEMLPTDNYQIYLGAECKHFNIGFHLDVAVRGRTWEDARRGFSAADTEADARAKMLIYLIEQGIVKP